MASRMRVLENHKLVGVFDRCHLYIFCDLTLSATEYSELVKKSLIYDNMK